MNQSGIGLSESKRRTSDFKMNHKKNSSPTFFKVVFFLFLVAHFLTPSAFAVVEKGLTNVLANPSFEQGLGPGNVSSALENGTAVANWSRSALGGFSTVLSDSAIDGASVLHYADAQTSVAGTPSISQNISGAREGDFVSLSGSVRIIAADGSNDVRLQIEFRDVNGNLIGAAINTGDGLFATTFPFRTLTTSGAAPAGTRSVTFTIEVVGAAPVGTSVFEFDQVVGTISKFPIAFDASASKPKVTRGSATFISSRVKNVSTSSFTGLELVATIPEGFTFIDSASRLDGSPIQSRLGSRIFTLGSLSSGGSKELGFLLVASGGVQIGKKYEVTFFVRDSTGAVQSGTKSVVLTIAADSFFDEGTIVGKVFDDQNENAVQDKGESGISGVKLATEEGIVVVTDRYGRYHIPAMKPARHIVKLDGHTLPQNTKLITEGTLLIETTPGMLNTANFAVKLPKSQIPEAYRNQLNVMITSGVDMTKPELSIDLAPEILRMGIGVFEVDPMFHIKTNYADLIAAWRIEIRGVSGEEVWTGYGLGSPPIEAPWNGRTELREPVSQGTYSYRLIVRDSQGREDWTQLKYFRVISKLDGHAPDNPKIEVPATGNMVIDRDGKRSIPIVAKPKVFVRGTTVPWDQIKVNGEPVPVNLDGSFEAEYYAPAGKQSVVVTAQDKEGNAVSYQEEVQLKENYFFMAALGEEELGLNATKGNLEVVGRKDIFDHGFYESGRLAFYLKGKIKGKFLVTSRYDTSDPRKALFTNLDPDQYYPVYGDGSEISYDAYDTKQRFYILVEKDKSFLKWGSYNTNFRDTELATHNRTFSGGKLFYESLASTRYGDPKQGFVVYTADVDQLADHNEFLGTNGSLFYLRNKNVIEGSEKVRVELRDTIQGITTHSWDLKSGADYEIDYNQGRIILSKPLSAVSYSPSIISNDILKGSETFLIVDYEFNSQGFTQDANNGLRGFMQLGDHIRVGGTAIEDKLPEGDYDLRGVDVTGKFGRNTKVTAEYARTQRSDIHNAVSFDGGITFSDMKAGNTVIKKSNQLFDDAYLVKGETRFRTGTELSGYAQRINPGFANADLIAQAGKRKAGLEIRQKVGEVATLSYRFDKQKMIDPTNLSEIFLTSPSESSVHNARFDVDYDGYVVVGEYRNQNAGVLPVGMRGLVTALDDVQFQNAFALQTGYRVSPELMPYLKGQVTSRGRGGSNHQFGGGLQALVMDGKGTVRFEELAGTIGDSTLLSFNVKADSKTDVYTILSSDPASSGSGRILNTTLGSSSQVNSRSRFYSEQEYSTYQSAERKANIVGYDTQLSDRWSLDSSFERSQIRDISDVNTHRNSGALEVKYLDKDFLKVTSRYELRADDGSEDRIHWFFRDTVDVKISEDLKFSGRFNRSDTNRFEDYAFRTDASTTELNMGFAYRPVKHNRWNALTKYTWLSEVGARGQFDTPDIFGVEVDETSHIFGFEVGYEVLPPFLGVTEKMAYRRSAIDVTDDTFYLSNVFWATRFNFHVIRKWDVILEYRMLRSFELLDNFDHGALVEIDREIMDYFRVGMGYNFTRFDDDLRTLNDFSRHGFFTRLSGKF